MIGPAAGRAATSDPRVARTAAPPDLETPLARLGRAWITPTPVFFVRCHHAVPEVDRVTWRLEVAGLVRAPLALDLAALRALPSRRTVITLECAGNGRRRFPEPAPPGVPWDLGAVGTAEWEGVLLDQVLELAGAMPQARHAWFEAADHGPDPGRDRFLRSLPLAEAAGHALLAWSMNGAPLPPEHGGPLRLVMPRWYAMASTKWLTRIRLEAAPCHARFMDRAYRFRRPGLDPAEGEPVTRLRIKSLITSPVEGAAVRAGPLRVTGFAWGGVDGVRAIELSADGGASWGPARLTGAETPAAWRRWEGTVAAAAGTRMTLAARATDGAGIAQPSEPLPDADGYGHHAIHRVTVEVAP